MNGEVLKSAKYRKFVWRLQWFSL